MVCLETARHLSFEQYTSWRRWLDDTGAYSQLTSIATGAKVYCYTSQVLRYWVILSGFRAFRAATKASFVMRWGRRSMMIPEIDAWTIDSKVLSASDIP